MFQDEEGRCRTSCCPSSHTSSSYRRSRRRPSSWMVDVLGLEETDARGPVGVPAGVGRMAALEPRRHRRPAAGGRAHRRGARTARTTRRSSAQRVDPELAVGWVEIVRRARQRVPLPRAARPAPARGVLGGRPLPGARRRRPRRTSRTARSGSPGAAPPPATSTTSRSRRADIHGDIAFYKNARPAAHGSDHVPSRASRSSRTMTCNAIRSTHDLALVPDFAPAAGALNHIAYRVDQRLDVERAAEVFMATTRRSSSAPASTASTRSRTSTCASPAASGSRSTRAAGRTTMPDWEPTKWSTQPGRHDAVEEPADAGLDDGVLAARRGCGRRSRHGRVPLDRTLRREMSDVRHVLIVGGGIGGLSTAIALRRAGFDVDVVEKNPAWDVYGVGIIQPGNALRALNELGLAERAVARGASDVRRPDVPGRRRDRHRRQRLAGRSCPGCRPGNGITRTRLHTILQDAVLGSGADVRAGVTVDDARGRRSTASTSAFTDGETRSYDLVIGADGLYSQIRELVFRADVEAEATPARCAGATTCRGSRGWTRSGSTSAPPAPAASCPLGAGPDVHADDREATGGRADPAAARGARGELPRAAGAASAARSPSTGS